MMRLLEFARTKGSKDKRKRKKKKKSSNTKINRKAVALAGLGVSGLGASTLAYKRFGRNLTVPLGTSPISKKTNYKFIPAVGRLPNLRNGFNPNRPLNRGLRLPATVYVKRPNGRFGRKGKIINGVMTYAENEMMVPLRLAERQRYLREKMMGLVSIKRKKKR